MARKRIETNVPANDLTELQHIISSYNANKELEKEYKELASSENTKIKTIMENLNISECEDESGEYVAKVSEQKRESFIEDALIQYLKDNGCAKDIVKKKEYVDMDALESAIYHEKIPADVVAGMDKCKEVKVMKVLRVSKKKGE